MLLNLKRPAGPSGLDGAGAKVRRVEGGAMIATINILPPF